MLTRSKANKNRQEVTNNEDIMDEIDPPPCQQQQQEPHKPLNKTHYPTSPASDPDPDHDPHIEPQLIMSLKNLNKDQITHHYQNL